MGPVGVGLSCNQLVQALSTRHSSQGSPLARTKRSLTHNEHCRGHRRPGIVHPLRYPSSLASAPSTSIRIPSSASVRVRSGRGTTPVVCARKWAEEALRLPPRSPEKVVGTSSPSAAVMLRPARKPSAVVGTSSPMGGALGSWHVGDAFAVVVRARTFRWHSWVSEQLPWQCVTHPRQLPQLVQ